MHWWTFVNNILEIRYSSSYWKVESLGGSRNASAQISGNDLWQLERCGMGKRLLMGRTEPANFTCKILDITSMLPRNMHDYSLSYDQRLGQRCIQFASEVMGDSDTVNTMTKSNRRCRWENYNVDLLLLYLFSLHFAVKNKKTEHLNFSLGELLFFWHDYQ